MKMPTLITPVKLGIQRHQRCGIVLQWNSNFLVHTFALILVWYLSLYIIPLQFTYRLMIPMLLPAQTMRVLICAALWLTMFDQFSGLREIYTILETNPRYSFSVEFGEPDRVQSGQSRLGPSEIRILTITDLSSPTPAHIHAEHKAPMSQLVCS